MQRHKCLGNNSVKMKVPSCVKELKKREDPLFPFLLIFVYPWDEKADILLIVNVFNMRILIVV
jgi:hypothetical protein